MKNCVWVIAIFFYFQGSSQVVPNVRIDSLFERLSPIYFNAINSGLFELPRDTTWQELQQYDHDAMSIKLPARWLELGGLGNIVEVSFDATGLYFPDTFNNRNILVGVFLLNQQGKSLEEARDLALKDYRLNPDRVFESGYMDSVYNFNLDENKKGYVLHTRFIRKSNQYNQSRYDLILFSDKLKKAYSIMISVQYADPSFSFEKNYALNAFAAKLYSLVNLK